MSHEQAPAADRDLRAWLSEDLIETLGAPASGELDAGALLGALAGAKPLALWNLRARAREALVERLRERGLEAADSDALWIGWAGALCAEARAGLISSDLARLERLLDDPLNAVRVVFAGSPRDAAGEAVFTQLGELAAALASAMS